MFPQLRRVRVVTDPNNMPIAVRTNIIADSLLRVTDKMPERLGKDVEMLCIQFKRYENILRRIADNQCTNPQQEVRELLSRET